MNTLKRYTMVPFLLLPLCVWGGERAEVRFYCLSLRFQTATTKLFGQNYTLDLTTDTSSSSPNGELAPFASGPFTHGSRFFLHDPVLLEDIKGVIFFDVPPQEDANTNGFPDFFEVSQSVGATTQGVFSDALEDGAVIATWSRAAGSSTGTCKLSLDGSMFGQFPDFIHTFQLIEYTGSLDYTAGSNSVGGTIQLTQTTSSTNSLAGPFTFTKVDTNRFNELFLEPGVWTNQTGQSLSYTNTFFQRDESVGTNYYGFVAFDDGDLNTPAPDYLIWFLSIDDLNDRDSNGIPDLSDDPSPPGPRRPQLVLSRSNSRLLFSISGEIGKLHELQEISSLSQTNWNKVLSITLTNDPQTVEIALPTEATKFWRLRVP